MANTKTSEILEAMEPLPANAASDTLGQKKLGEAALISIAISLKRIADSRSEVFYVDRGIPGLDPSLIDGD